MNETDAQRANGEFQVILQGSKSMSQSHCQYLVTRVKLGEGTFSKVYTGYRQELVAVKKILLEKMEKHRSNLDDEIRIMRRLKHENIVNLLDVIHHNEQIYLILEHCKDGDFKRFLRKRPMREKHAQMYLKQLMEGLRYLKSQGVMHRDLKPQNLLLTNDFKTLKIADFGFAKTVSSEASLAETMCGTPFYMSPEIMHGKKYDSQADLWSVGIIMYELFYGTHPYGDAVGHYELRDRIDTKSIVYPKFPTETKNEISDEGLSLLKALLQKDPIFRITWEAFFTHIWFYPGVIAPSNGENSDIAHTKSLAIANIVTPTVSNLTKAATTVSTSTSISISPGPLVGSVPVGSPLTQHNVGIFEMEESSDAKPSPLFTVSATSPTSQGSDSVNSFFNLVDNYRSAPIISTSMIKNSSQTRQVPTPSQPLSQPHRSSARTLSSLPQQTSSSYQRASSSSRTQTNVQYSTRPTNFQQLSSVPKLINATSTPKPIVMRPPITAASSPGVFLGTTPPVFSPSAIIVNHTDNDDEADNSDDDDETTNNKNSAMSSLREYWNTSVRLAKDSLRSFSSLP